MSYLEKNNLIYLPLFTFITKMIKFNFAILLFLKIRVFDEKCVWKDGFLNPTWPKFRDLHWFWLVIDWFLLGGNGVEQKLITGDLCIIAC